MKRLLILVCTFLIFLTGCSFKDNPIFLKDSKSESRNLDNFHYEVEKVILSSSYQNLKPNVDISKIEDNPKIIVSAGLTESSGIEIEDITKTSDTINIFIKNISRKETNKFLVPQAHIKLFGVSSKEIENLEFNIVNTNYEIYTLNSEVNDIIKKLTSELKFTYTYFPKIELNKVDNKMYWDMSFSKVFNNEYVTSPLIDLDVLVDAETGEVVKYEKNNVSSFIDNGTVLHYLDNKYIVYKKIGKGENKDNIETLWIYDIKSKKKKELYSSSIPIASAKISHDSRHIALIEKDDSITQLYILSLHDNKTYKPNLGGNKNFTFASWMNDRFLYIVETLQDNSLIYKYDIDEDKIIETNGIGFKINTFCHNKDYITMTTLSDNKEDNTIYLVEDFDNFKLTFEGSTPKFLNSNKIGFLRYVESTGLNELVIYDLANDEYFDVIDLNISNFIGLDDNNMLVIEKNKSDADFTIYEYSFKDKSIKKLQYSTTDNIWLDKEERTIYLNLLEPNKIDGEKLIINLFDTE